MIRIRSYGKEKTVENLAALRRLVERGRVLDNDEAFNPLEEEWLPVRYLIEDAEEDVHLSEMLNEALPLKSPDEQDSYDELRNFEAIQPKQIEARQTRSSNSNNGNAKRRNRKHNASSQTGGAQHVVIDPRLKKPAAGNQPQVLYFWQSGIVIILALMFFAPLGITLLIMRPRVGLLGHPLIKAALILAFAAVWIASLFPEEINAAVLSKAFSEGG